MKRMILLIALVVIGLYAAIGQVPQFHSASSGVRFKRNKMWLWNKPPEQYSVLNMDDAFLLEEKDVVSVIYNKLVYWSTNDSSQKKIMKTEQIIIQNEQSVWNATISSIKEDVVSWKKPHPFKSRAAAGTMSSSTIEAKYAAQIKSYFNAPMEDKKQMVDSTIVLQKRFVSEDLFFFRLINKSDTNYYIYFVQYDTNGTNVVFDKTWGDPNDGEVSLVFCLPASSSLDISSFTFYEDNETQYVPLASESMINIKLLQKELQKEAISETVESLLQIGVCSTPSK